MTNKSKLVYRIVFSLLIVLIVSSCASAEIRAVRKGDLEAIREFLADGGDPDTFDDDGNALIHIAVQYGQEQSLKILLEADADPNVKNRRGDTAAIMAAGADRRDMMDLLLKHGGDMRLRGSESKSTLMLAASKGNVSLMDILLKLGVPVDGLDDRGQSALFYSTAAQDTGALAFLLDNGADPRITDKDLGTPLHLLRRNNQVAYGRMLLDAGTDLASIKSSTGETALHVASGAGAFDLVVLYLDGGAQSQINLSSHTLGAPLFYALNDRLSSAEGVRTAELLLSRGADVFQVSVKNTLPIVHAVEKLDVPRTDVLIRYGADVHIVLQEDQTLMHKAVFRKFSDLVFLLLEADVEPDTRDVHGRTPLFYAVERKDLKTVEILLANSADPNISANDGSNILYLALKDDVHKREGLSELTSLLIRYGAEPVPSKEPLRPLLLKTAESGNVDAARILLKAGTDPDSAGPDGKTALMRSSEGDLTALMEQLLLWGAKVNIADNRGDTAIHFASRAGAVGAVELLLRYNADPDPVNYSNLRPIESVPPNPRGERIVEILLAAGAAPLPIPPVVEPETETEIEDETEGGSVTESGVEETPAGEDSIEAETETETETDSDSGIAGIPSEDSEIESQQEHWGKARLLVRGEEEPRRISSKRVVFPNYSASVPESFPRNMYSKFNNREVAVYIRNDSALSCEIYIVNSDGITGAIASIPSGEVFKMGSRQGNSYPVYGIDGSYFGAFQTTGQEEQYYRLVERE